MFKKICWLLVAAAVLFLLLQPSVPRFLSNHGLLFDERAMHAILFAVYYLVAVIAWGKPVLQFLLVILFSLLTEFLQLLTGRSFQLQDILFNLIGALPFFVFFLFRPRRLTKQLR